MESYKSIYSSEELATMIFYIHSINIFALLSYDTNIELKDYVKSLNDENKDFTIRVSNRFKQSIKKMHETRERLCHHSLSVTQELEKAFESIETADANHQPLTYLLELADAYDGLILQLGCLIAKTHFDSDKTKAIFDYLAEYDKSIPKPYEPDWERLRSLRETTKQKDN